MGEIELYKDYVNMEVKMKTGYECTAYFKGIDGLGNCNDECQWWHDGACPCAKGSEVWDGKEHYTKEPRRSE